MNEQTRTDRLLVYSKKMLHAQCMGLRPSAFMGRFSGPRILVNSIPKAGTNLIDRVLTLMPVMRMAPYHTMMGWSSLTHENEKRLRRLRKGQFINAHLPAHRNLLDLLKELAIKTIFLIRDPRDVIVSHYRYVHTIDVNHPSHEAIAKLPNDNARLASIIMGIDGLVAPVDELWKRFDGWFDAANTLVIRYESLVGPNGGGDVSIQIETIRCIATHLDLRLGDDELECIAANAYSSATPTFRAGRTNCWKHEFTSEHVALFKAQTGDLLTKLGYEKSNEWGID